MQVSRPQCGMRKNGWTGWTYLPKTPKNLHSGITERTFRPVYVWMDGTNISDGTTTIAPLELIYLLCSTQCDTLNVLSQNINRTIHIYFNLNICVWTQIWLKYCFPLKKVFQIRELRWNLKKGKTNPIFLSQSFLLAPSGALVFIMVYYIPAAARPLCLNFSDSSESKVLKRPNMCYIF